MSSRSAQRDASLDLIRILGAYLVIVCHTIPYIRLDALTPITRYIVFFFQSFSKIAVPLFLMVSGCTLLPKADTLFKTLNRIFRIAAVLLLFSLMHAFLHLGGNAVSSFRFLSFLESIYRAPMITPYWYLYAYIGILLMLPLLQKLVKAMSKTDFVYFFLISFLFFGVWPVFVEYTPISEYTHHFSLPLFSTHICYLFMGYAFYRIFRTGLPVPFLLVVLLASLMTNAFLMNHDFVSSTGTSYAFMDNIAFLPMLLASASFFLLIRRMKLSQKTAAIATVLGSCAFGVYLISDLFLIVLIPVFYTMRSSIGQIQAVLLYQPLVFCASVLSVALLRRVPVFNKLL